MPVSPLFGDTGKQPSMSALKFKQTIIYWIIGWIGLYLILQYKFAYQFFYVEQHLLFEWTTEYVKTHLLQIGGPTDYAARFLMQFYILPHGGPLITATLIVATAYLTDRLIRSSHSVQQWTILSCFPAMVLFVYHLDYYYCIQGTLAFLSALIALLLGIRLSSDKKRSIFYSLSVVILFFVAGPISLLFAIVALVWELFGYKQRSPVIVIPVILAGLLSTWAIYRVPEPRMAFLPDFYYYSRLRPHLFFYLPWIVLPLLVGLAFTFKPHKPMKRYLLLIGLTIQLFLLIDSTIWGIKKIADTESTTAKRFSYYAGQQKWDDIIRERSSIKDFISQNLLNLALCEKGSLLSNLLSVTQYGPRGLLVEWNRSEIVSMLYSDINYCIGNIALSQRFAFEAHITNLYGGNPRMLKRLIQTNLIFGAYAVAEKYIAQLENTLFYRKWATAQRIYLYNDSLVANDRELGTKRRFLLQNDYLSSSGFSLDELKKLIDTDPHNKAAFEYGAALCLLMKEPNETRKFIDRYYGTEALPQLPVVLQEAITIIEEQDTDYWKKRGITNETVSRFIEFRKLILQNKQHQNIATMLAPKFKQSYWFYYMFD